MSAGAAARLGAAASDRWFLVPRRVRDPRLRLFCFPFAGGSAGTFVGWPAALPGDVELWAAQLPGRATRIGDPAIGDMTLLLDHLEAAMAPALDRPFALFGHSMGAIIIFELVRRLRRQGRRLPSGLIAAGRRAPQLPPEEPIHHLGDRQFLDEIHRMGGTPDGVLHEPELVELVLPPLRADFRAIERWTYAPEPPLPVPLFALGGEQDLEVSRAQLEAWRAQTSHAFTAVYFPGGHFFLNTQRQQLLSAVAQFLDGVRGAGWR